MKKVAIAFAGLLCAGTMACGSASSVIKLPQDVKIFGVEATRDLGLTFRNYTTLGIVKATIKDADCGFKCMLSYEPEYLFWDPIVEKMINEELAAKAKTLGADAVIDVDYGLWSAASGGGGLPIPGFDAFLNVHEYGAIGVAVKFTGEPMK
jgi:hypothetical protein